MRCSGIRRCFSLCKPHTGARCFSRVSNCQSQGQGEAETLPRNSSSRGGPGAEQGAVCCTRKPLQLPEKEKAWRPWVDLESRKWSFCSSQRVPGASKYTHPLPLNHPLLLPGTQTGKVWPAPSTWQRLTPTLLASRTTMPRL